MHLQLNKEEQRLLTELVAARIKELHPEIRRSMEHGYKDKLKNELACLEQLIGRMEGPAESDGDALEKGE